MFSGRFGSRSVSRRIVTSCSSISGTKAISTGIFPNRTNGELDLVGRRWKTIVFTKPELDQDGVLLLDLHSATEVARAE